jgi:hypothetical protein
VAAHLPLPVQLAYARAIAFAGCESAANWQFVPGVATEETDRINAARLMLLKLQTGQCDPRWSSWLLDRMFEAVTDTPGGTIGDLLHALYDVLGDYDCDLTYHVANFIQSVVVGGITRDRLSFQTLNFNWLIQGTLAARTPAQSYLAFLALPPEVLSPHCIVAILKRLQLTPYWEKAFAVMNDDLRNEEGRRLVREWLAEGVDPSRAGDVRRVLEDF